MWITAGHDTIPAGTAAAGSEVSVGETDGLSRQPVDVWRMNVGVAVASKVIPAYVIGYENNKVG